MYVERKMELKKQQILWNMFIDVCDSLTEQMFSQSPSQFNCM